jgi:hypothetical protein
MAHYNKIRKIRNINNVEMLKELKEPATRGLAPNFSTILYF